MSIHLSKKHRLCVLTTWKSTRVSLLLLFLLDRGMLPTSNLIPSNKCWPLIRGAFQFILPLTELPTGYLSLFEQARLTLPLCSFSPTPHSFRPASLFCLLPIRKPRISPFLGHHCSSCPLFSHGTQLEMFPNDLFIYSNLEIQSVRG